VGEEGISIGGHASTARGRAQAFPLFLRTPFVAELPNLTWKHVGEGRVSWGQPRLPSQDSGVPVLLNFADSSVFASF